MRDRAAVREGVLALAVELVVAVALWAGVVTTAGWLSILIGVVAGLVTLHLLVTAILLVGARLGLRALQRWIDDLPPHERHRLR
ncbi:MULTISPECIES: hypothetical protein [Aeromicrobium]|jgi:hypothetical protein|uniref:hypothetical protein n=1 Tax=Aeromicrobium TaxID=2040 RepID=UPI000AB8AAE0|nr:MULTISPECIES: hypothetical protein [Aeromicrobium]